MEGRECENRRQMRHFSCWTNCHSYHLSKQLGQSRSRTACPLSHYSYMFHMCSLMHMCSLPSSTLTSPCRDPFCTKSSHTSLTNSQQTIPVHHCKLSQGKKNSARDWAQKVVGWWGRGSSGCCQPRCGSAGGLPPVCTCMLCGSSLPESLLPSSGHHGADQPDRTAQGPRRVGHPWHVQSRAFSGKWTV